MQPTDSSLVIERRHDLDALRAIAMLLGIALHAMISFIPGIGAGWAVEDSQASEGFGLMLAWIHGFRMPLFFLISGFFTMMLLRKRGLGALLLHRFKRIFLPLVIGVFTIVPAVWGVSIYVGLAVAWDDAAKQEVTVADAHQDDQTLSESCWLMAATGDSDGLTEWIGAGGDIRHREEDGATALHGAFLFGQPKTAQILIDAGASPSDSNQRGETATDMLVVPWGITQYIAQLVKIDVDEAAVLKGRSEIAQRLDLPNADSIGVEESVSDKALFALFYFPFFHHLWFLAFLCWLVCGFAVCVWIGRLVRFPRPAAWLSASPLRYLWVIPLTVAAQWFMRGDGLSFGPDTSIGLLPLPSVLAYYAVFFGVGAMYFDATLESEQKTPRTLESWASVLISVCILFPIGLTALEHHTHAWRLIGLCAQAGYAWLMTFGLMGVFAKLLSRQSKTLRYVSDSSYWLYLVHIPLVIYLQYLVRSYEVSPSLKFLGICVASSVILLLSYQIFVRYTPIGTLLNGKRLKWGRTNPVGAGPASTEPLSTEPLSTEPLGAEPLGTARTDHATDTGGGPERVFPTAET